MTIKKTVFGSLSDGTPVERFTLSNKNGFEAGIMTWGGALVSLKVPDAKGRQADVTLGFDTLEGYLAPHPYIGTLVGRFGNRIADARFTLDGREYRLAANDGQNHLHGGTKGFDKVLWQARPIDGADPSLELKHVSPDNDEGYPGNLSVTVLYTLEQDGLRIDYTATTDRYTVVNLTHHGYFNLAGKGTILDHVFEAAASSFLVAGKGLIPTGEIRPVKGTPMDFTRPSALGRRIHDSDDQVKNAGGYDLNFVLDKEKAGALEFAARMTDPVSGRSMEVWTTEPGLQLYTGNFLDGSLTGKNGAKYEKHAGFCLETQHFPDSPNQPAFPSTLLKPGQTYRHTTLFRFSAEA